MENKGQGSPSENSTGNNQQNPSPPRRNPEETNSLPISRISSAFNEAISSQIAAINNVSGGVPVDEYTGILVRRNPISPPLEGVPPPPFFSRITRARILHMLTAKGLEGDYEQILLATARAIAESHSYLIQDNIIYIPMSHQICVVQFQDEEIDNASAEEDFDQVDSPVDSEDDKSPEADEVVVYGVSPQEGHVDNNTINELVVDDDITLEEMWALEAMYGLPEHVVHHQLRSKEYRLTPNDEQHEVSCRICLELFEDGDKTAKLVCGDMFHYDCISRWLTRKNLCPLCRETGVYP